TIRTLILAVDPLLTKTYNLSVCANQLPYTWLGHVFNGATTVRDAAEGGGGSCDTIRTLILAVDPLLTKTYNLSVCANQLPYTWLDNGINGANTITDTAAGGGGSCDTIRTLILAVDPLLTKTYNLSVCANQLPYTWLGHVFNGANTITDTAAGGGGSCDTIRTLILAVDPLLTKTYNLSVCANQLPYTWLDNGINGANTITDTAAGGGGSCDTIRTLILAVDPLLTKTYNLSVCANQLPYTWLGHVFNGANTITDTAAGGGGSCDTIRTLILAVDPLLTKTYNLSVCANQLPYTWLDNGINGANTITDTAAGGGSSCDKITTLMLAGHLLLPNTYNLSVCANQLPYTWLGHVFNGANTITDTAAGGGGSCDTIRTLILAVDPLLTKTYNLSVCANQLPYTWLGHVFNGATTVRDAAEGGGGSCDTIRTLILAVDPLLTKTYNLSVCANQLPYTWLGHVFNGANTITDTAAGGGGSCDTIRTLILAVDPLLTKTYNLSVCANQLPYTWLGHVFNGANTITDTAAGGGGSCDTIRTLILAVDPLLTKTYNLSVCANQLPYTWLGHVFNGANTITDTAAGGRCICDTITILILAVDPLLTKTYNLSVCANQLPYTWLGHVFNGASTITDTAAGGGGRCDRIRTLILAVDRLLMKTYNLSVCANQLPYTWLGHVSNGANTITDTAACGDGSCDTIRTLILPTQPFSDMTYN